MRCRTLKESKLFLTHLKLSVCPDKFISLLLVFVFLEISQIIILAKESDAEMTVLTLITHLILLLILQGR